MARKPRVGAVLNAALHAPADGADASATGTHISAIVTNITIEKWLTLFPANFGRSSQRIWPVNMTDPASVSSSPRPSLKFFQSTPASTTTPATTSPQLRKTFPAGQRRWHNATQIGMNRQ